jgi:ATP-dependent RNA helicase DeaD
MSISDVAALSGFIGLGLDEKIVKELSALGYEEPTPIQREAIPPLLEGRDLLGQAATGTGKTAAFSLPLLQAIHEAPKGKSQYTAALILTPTRELAVQVAEAIHKYGRSLGITVLPIYGGADMRQQLRALSRGVDVVVATPGRALDHIRRGSLKLDRVRTVVLDEADEMLDMGFAEDLEAILNEAPDERQTALFSATMAPKVAAVANKHLKDPVRLTIARDTVKAGTTPKVRQVAYIVPRAHKTATLGRVLDMESPTSAIVFCRTRTEVDELTEALTARGYQAGALHGGMSQEQRDRMMKKFRANAMDLLIATDVAARGLDVEHLSHVVNYDVPTSPEAYIHRIGRTGRAGREGVAVTLAEPREHGYLRNIERLTKQKIEVATIPTIADLRARRLELTRTMIRETLLEGELDSFRVVVESLADGEFDVMDVAAAAVKAAHEAAGNGGEQEVEIPVVFDVHGAGKGKRDKRNGQSKGERREAQAFDGKRGKKKDKWDGDERKGRVESRDQRSEKGGKKAKRARSNPEWEVSRLYIGAGRKAKIRPGDIVGAIANEVGVDSDAVGAIEIYDRYSLVEIPNEIAEDIIDALRSSTIKGKRVVVRRDKEF